MSSSRSEHLDSLKATLAFGLSLVAIASPYLAKIVPLANDMEATGKMAGTVVSLLTFSAIFYYYGGQDPQRVSRFNRPGIFAVLTLIIALTSFLVCVIRRGYDPMISPLGPIDEQIMSLVLLVVHSTAWTAFFALISILIVHRAELRVATPVPVVPTSEDGESSAVTMPYPCSGRGHTVAQPTLLISVIGAQWRKIRSNSIGARSSLPLSLFQSLEEVTNPELDYRVRLAALRAARRRRSLMWLLCVALPLRTKAASARKMLLATAENILQAQSPLISAQKEVTKITDRARLFGKIIEIIGLWQVQPIWVGLQRIFLGLRSTIQMLIKLRPSLTSAEQSLILLGSSFPALLMHTDVTFPSRRKTPSEKIRNLQDSSLQQIARGEMKSIAVDYGKLATELRSEFESIPPEHVERPFLLGYSAQLHTVAAAYFLSVPDYGQFFEQIETLVPLCGGLRQAESAIFFVDLYCSTLDEVADTLSEDELATKSAMRQLLEQIKAEEAEK